MFSINIQNFSIKPLISTAVIGVLAVTAVVIFNQQFNFNPAVKALLSRVDLKKQSILKNNIVEKQQASNLSSKKFKSIIKLVNPFQPLSAPEIFDSAALSDKIDGKAELYLPAGFKSLSCQRFTIELNRKSDKQLDADKSLDGSELSKAGNDLNLWIELFIYDMTVYDNAFAVFSRQRRENSTSIPIAAYAYSTENALFFVHGHFYIEMIASSASADAVKFMIDLAESFIKDNPDIEPQKIDVPDLFPTKFLNKESITLITSDAFGFDRFNNIYIADYNLNGVSVTAFISKRDSIESAAKLADEYNSFLINFGGSKINVRLETKVVYGIEIMDTYEFVFSSGIYLAGVRETEDLETAEALLNALYNEINAEAGNNNLK